LGGNVSLALLLTVTTNILGIFTMPFILPHMARAAALTTLAAAAAAAAGPSAAATVTLEPLPLMLQLCQTILVPTMLGASIRCLVPGAAAAIDRNKKILSYINAGLLASVPWMQVGQGASLAGYAYSRHSSIVPVLVSPRDQQVAGCITVTQRYRSCDWPFAGSVMQAES
jgi:sodium/bile acid cotransporter 7